ncbi:MAG: bifunctional 4-hydroxy-2-oxoglutarate aldolase/2-dehydro-3-deoxy-phosphogluconate aldolase, partial [Treponema sp.]|nr:bifunctional 4-hydroxy-2-oxoglutarate aldolase/2-dehydro-3-deoxy-phosphogluconate aldolase [Treponema sp.]
MDVLEIIKDCRIVPVVKIDDAERAVPLAKALLAGGIPIIEITYRTQAAQASIAKIVKACPQMTVGAGTVISPELAKSAVLAGASFLVSPGSNDATIEWASKHNIPVIPGVATPTEIESALMKGINVLKLFPAEV